MKISTEVCACLSFTLFLNLVNSYKKLKSCRCIWAYLFFLAVLKLFVKNVGIHKCKHKFTQRLYLVRLSHSVQAKILSTKLIREVNLQNSHPIHRKSAKPGKIENLTDISWCQGAELCVMNQETHRSEDMRDHVKVENL